MTRITLEGPQSCTIFCFAGIPYGCITFLLFSFSVSSKQQLLCFVHGQGQESKPKNSTKNFVWFHNQSPLLTMG